MAGASSLEVYKVETEELRNGMFCCEMDGSLPEKQFPAPFSAKIIPWINFAWI